MTARDILALLGARHAGDIFVPECKDGQSSGRQHRRLDAWAMPRSYSPLRMLGYEVKVGRQDFLKDDKWQAYLPLCHELYFVCPAKLIDPAEMPDGVGLLWASATGSMLYTKRKAAYRAVGPPVDLLLYVLISRCKIQREYEPQSAREYWTKWLEDRKADATLGHAVSRKVRELYNKTQAHNKALVKQMKEYDSIREQIQRLGIDPDNTYGLEWAVRHRVDEILGLAPDGFRTTVQAVQDACGRLVEELAAARYADQTAQTAAHGIRQEDG